MRVLFVSPFPPAPDGIGRYSHTLIAALEDGGHQSAVVVPRKWESYPERVIGIVGFRKSENARLLNDVIAWRPDLIHVQFAVAAFGSKTPALLNWLHSVQAAAIPVVITLHEVTRDIASLRGVGRALYRKIVSCCERIIVHTASAKEVMCHALGVAESKVTIVPHPETPPPVFESGSAPDELRQRYLVGNLPVLLAFGFVHVDKGLDDLVAALGRLAQLRTLPEMRLVVAGAVRPRFGIFQLFELRDRLYFARIQRTIRRLLPDGLVIHTGYVPDEDVVGWFQAADAVVLPYRRSIDNSGVCSIARALGTPILASTASGLREQYGESPWTFPPHDPERMATVIADFFAAPHGERTVGVVEPASSAELERVAAATVRVYEAATGAGLPLTEAGKS